MTAKDRYDSLFQYYGEQNHVDWRLLKAQATLESGLDPDIAGPTGDLGLSQFIESTWKMVTGRWHKRSGALIDRRDPEDAIQAQAEFMGGLLHQFKDDHRLALAAYNCGPGRVQRGLDHGFTYESMTIPASTRAYVERVTRILATS